MKWSEKSAKCVFFLGRDVKRIVAARGLHIICNQGAETSHFDGSSGRR